MSLYKLKDSPFWWVSIVNPRTGQRIRRSTKLTNKAKAKVFEENLILSLIAIQNHFTAPMRMPQAPRVHKHTWNEATERWLKESEHKKDRINDITKVQWLLPHLANRRLCDINSNLIQKIADIKAQQTSPSTANRILTLIRTILNRAHKQWEWTEKVPYIRLYKEPHRRIRYLTKQEAHTLLAQLPNHLKDMALFSLNTGLRASNVTGLTWSQVNLEQRHLFINADQAKAGRAISVPLNNDAASVIMRQQGNHSIYVFTFKGNPVKQLNTAAWHKALKRAGIENFRWHDLRHTWASWHIQAGTPMHILQELGGWHSYEMVQRYAHLSSEHLAKFSNAINL